MPTRKRFLLLAGATALGGIVWPRWTDDVATRRARAKPPHLIASKARRRAAETICADPKISVAEPMLVPALTRREATELVRTLYRKEQLTRELDFEQRRYGRDYWASECNGP